MHKLNSVELPLISGTKEKKKVPSRSGLNWGQRPGRNQNQAYIAVPIEIQRSKFFPPVGELFEIEFDDGFKVECVRAQQNGKAIHSAKDNSILGSYFRSRLGLNSGDLVIIDHLISYGCLTLTASKISNKKYKFDFQSKDSV